MFDDENDESILLNCGSCSESSGKLTLCIWCSRTGLCKKCLDPSALPYVCGTLKWCCSACSKLNLTEYLCLISSKLSKLEKIETDVTEIKQSLKQTIDAATEPEQLSNHMIMPTNGSYTRGFSGPLSNHSAMPTIGSYSGAVKTSMTLNPAKQMFEKSNKPRRESTNSISSDASRKRRRTTVTEVAVVQGKRSDTVFKGVKPAPRKPPRKHYFLSRVPPSIDKSAVMDSCHSQILDPIACRELPSRNKNLRSFHIVFPEEKTDMIECADTWPEDIILRRYFLNEEARIWLNTLNIEQLNNT